MTKHPGRSRMITIRVRDIVIQMSPRSLTLFIAGIIICLLVWKFWFSVDEKGNFSFGMKSVQSRPPVEKVLRKP